MAAPTASRLLISKSLSLQPLILISGALISSTDADLKGEAGWHRDGISLSLALSSALCEQYPLIKPFTLFLS